MVDGVSVGQKFGYKDNSQSKPCFKLLRAVYAVASIESLKRKKTKNGASITDGSRPGDLVTREEVITMLDRLAASL